MMSHPHLVQRQRRIMRPHSTGNGFLAFVGGFIAGEWFIHLLRQWLS